MKLSETERSSNSGSDPQRDSRREGKRKILYAKRLTFKLYLSVCSGGSTDPGKAAARQQDLGLIIGKADLPLGEVGTALHVLASLSSQHAGQLLRASPCTQCWVCLQQAALAAVPLDSTCGSNPEILLK